MKQLTVTWPLHSCFQLEEEEVLSFWLVKVGWGSCLQLASPRSICGTSCRPCILKDKVGLLVLQSHGLLLILWMTCAIALEELFRSDGPKQGSWPLKEQVTPQDWRESVPPNAFQEPRRVGRMDSRGILCLCSRLPVQFPQEGSKTLKDCSFCV